MLRIVAALVMVAIVAVAAAGRRALMAPYVEIEMRGASGLETRPFPSGADRWPHLPAHGGIPAGPRRFVARIALWEPHGVRVFGFVIGNGFVGRGFQVDEVTSASGVVAVLYEANDERNWVTLQAPPDATAADLADRAIAYLQEHARAGR